jgi:hypothetical protein
MRYAVYFIMILIPSVFSLTACNSSKELSRPEAAELLQKGFDHLHRPLKIQLGHSDSGGPDAEVMERAGLLAIRRTPSNFAGVPIVNYQTELTEKGKDELKGMYSIGQDNKMELLIATMKVLEITGINGDEKEAMAEYTWKWELTPTGQRLASLHALPPSFTAAQRTTFTGKSCFDRYDSGWRVVACPGIHL